MYSFHISLVAERHMAIYITVSGLFVLVKNIKTKDKGALSVNIFDSSVW